MFMRQGIAASPGSAHAAARAETRVVRQPGERLIMSCFASCPAGGLQRDPPLTLGQNRRDFLKRRCSGGHREKRAVNGQHLTERRGQAGGSRPQPLRHSRGQQPRDDRIEQRRIGDAMKIGKRTLAKTADGLMPLGLPRLG